MEIEYSVRTNQKHKQNSLKKRKTKSVFENEQKIKFSVKDEGIGIKDTSKIFERYYRGDKITGGFGIGLSIVKNICLKNKIEIKVESEINKGTTFIYLLDQKMLQLFE